MEIPGYLPIRQHLITESLLVVQTQPYLFVMKHLHKEMLPGISIQGLWAYLFASSPPVNYGHPLWLGDRQSDRLSLLPTLEDNTLMDLHLQEL